VVVAGSHLKLKFIHYFKELFHHKDTKGTKFPKGFLVISYYFILCVLRELFGYLIITGLLERIGTQLEFE